MPEQKPSPRAAYRHFHDITTRWMDNDVYGHVNNVVYYSYFDTAVNEYLIANGVLDPEKGEVIGLVVETGCRYFASAAFPEKLTAGIRVARLGNSSVRYEVGIFREDQETAIAEGFFVHVYVDSNSRRPVSLPAPLRTVLTGLLVPPLQSA